MSDISLFHSFDEHVANVSFNIAACTMIMSRSVGTVKLMAKHGNGDFGLLLLRMCIMFHNNNTTLWRFVNWHVVRPATGNLPTSTDVLGRMLPLWCTRVHMHTVSMSGVCSHVLNAGKPLVTGSLCLGSVFGHYQVANRALIRQGQGPTATI